MTWEELKEKAKEMGAMEFFSIMTGSSSFKWRGLEFLDIGIIKQSDGSLLSKNKTPEQMLMIMRGLE